MLRLTVLRLAAAALTLGGAVDGAVIHHSHKRRPGEIVAPAGGGNVFGPGLSVPTSLPGHLPTIPILPGATSTTAQATTTTRPAATTTSRVTTTIVGPTTTAGRATTTTAPTVPGNGPTLGPCPVFPASNAWNQDVSGLPVLAKSATYVNAIGGASHLHPDFGSNPDYGIPYVVVGPGQPLVPITYDQYGDESDPGPWPVPLNAPVEGGGAGDSHVLVADTARCKLDELYAAHRSGSGWVAGSGAQFDLNTGALRPEGWTSADAAGLPILPGLVRYDEVTAGAIRHALRFTVPRSQNGHILPATHDAGSNDTSLPPMGLRMRLKASYDISRFTGASRVVLEALKTYGMIVADNGSGWYISGATDTRWNDDDLDQLKSVPGSAFEAVDTGPIRKTS